MSAGDNSSMWTANKMGAEMLGRCVSVVEKNSKSVDVNPVDCSISKDVASRMELKRRLDAGGK